MKESISVNEEAYAELCEALAIAADPELIGEFLVCLLTPKELAEVSSRWALVREISKGTTQREVARTMGLSLCKITRGARELKKENSPFKRMIDVYLAAKPEV
ncbi:MAG TPA: Trp family transcriptional regulator [Treponemataceae bacterium]|jgi:TrpR family trp operon transcriptional repressor|nr:MAG: Trp operon repressor [Spirochaetes bacterium ADurb.Bin269]TAH54291.1 MAG: transcriptional regulator [Treponema sp.]HOC28117.1 Trp family transcriptional regulator [Treponemataceae bacterium]HPX47374.1 Trp family transcriptional regulator [Treponemataceae bacterium]HQL33305.1 Trp family transcriptional regulator [Treponemataceae bacterium]